MKRPMKARMKVPAIALAAGQAALFSMVLLASLVSLAATGCDRPPPADKAKEWTPADHDRAEEQTAGGGAAGSQAPAQTSPRRGEGGSGGGGGATAGAGDPLIEVAWQENCLSCHGPLGQGDGPTGPMVKASDLTREEWQARVTDGDIAAVITTGKSKMPKFDLPPKVVEGLVARIRAMRGR
jgi:mono/diheme cytochrome c family protein